MVGGGRWLVVAELVLVLVLVSMLDTVIVVAHRRSSGVRKDKIPTRMSRS